MAPWFFMILLLHSLVCGHTAAKVREVTSLLGQDCVLACGAKEEPGVQYRAIRWYKLIQEPESGLRGLVVRGLPDGETHWYNSSEAQVPLGLLDGSHSLSLRNLTCADGGRYSCHLSAPVGQQNREGEVLLRLTGCPEVRPAPFDTFWTLVPVFALVIAFLTFGISYLCVRSTVRERSRTKQRFLEAPLKPLEAKNLKLIYTLGSKPNTRNVCV